MNTLKKGAAALAAALLVAGTAVGIAAAAARRGAPGGGRHQGQRGVEQAPGQQLIESRVQRVAQGAEEVGAAALLGRDEGVAAGAGVATEREHGHAGVQARRDEVGLVVSHGEFLCAGRAPRGRGGTAAAALQGQDEIEHAVTIAAPTDSPAPLTAEYCSGS